MVEGGGFPACTPPTVRASERGVVGLSAERGPGRSPPRRDGRRRTPRSLQGRSCGAGDPSRSDPIVARVKRQKGAIDGVRASRGSLAICQPHRPRSEVGRGKKAGRMPSLPANEHQIGLVRSLTLEHVERAGRDLGERAGRVFVAAFANTVVLIVFQA